MSQITSLLKPWQQHAVRALAARLELSGRSAAFAAGRWDGRTLALPVLHLDDFTGIPFLENIAGVEEYQHRARCRAETGDLYAAVTPVPAGYEEYCRERLGLPAVDLLHTPVEHGPPLAVTRACAEPGPRRQLAARAASCSTTSVRSQARASST